jgi:hypothetical protein
MDQQTTKGGASSSTKRWLIIGGVSAVAIVAIVCGVYFGLSSNKSKDSTDYNSVQVYGNKTVGCPLSKTTVFTTKPGTGDSGLYCCPAGEQPEDGKCDEISTGDVESDFKPAVFNDIISNDFMNDFIMDFSDIWTTKDNFPDTDLATDTDNTVVSLSFVLHSRRLFSTRTQRPNQ